MSGMDSFGRKVSSFKGAELPSMPARSSSDPTRSDSEPGHAATADGPVDVGQDAVMHHLRVALQRLGAGPVDRTGLGRPIPGSAADADGDSDSPSDEDGSHDDWDRSLSPSPPLPLPLPLPLSIMFCFFPRDQWGMAFSISLFLRSCIHAHVCMDAHICACRRCTHSLFHMHVRTQAIHACVCVRETGVTRGQGLGRYRGRGGEQSEGGRGPAARGGGRGRRRKRGWG